MLWTGSISCFVSIQEYPSWFTSTITCRDALPTCSTHNCATKDQAQGPLCSSWTWKVRGMCNPDCSWPWPYMLPQESPLYAGQSVSVINNYRTLWLPCHCKYAQPIMAHTSSKSLVELSTGEQETTFVNVTQMLSSLTHTPRLKWLDNLSPLHSTSEAVPATASTLLLPQYNHLLLPQHPSKLQPKALQQQPAPSGRHL